MSTRERDLEYERLNTVPEEEDEDSETMIKCVNFHFCRALLPNWWWDCKACYVCTNCDVMFGDWMEMRRDERNLDAAKLVFSAAPIDCPDCRRTTTDNVKHPWCDHVFCLRCFEANQDGIPLASPPFPYPHLESKYEETSDDPMWVRDFPRIAVWQDLDSQVADLLEDHKASLDRSCPVCRHEQKYYGTDNDNNNDV